jgi:hypothetical protein
MSSEPTLTTAICEADRCPIVGDTLNIRANSLTTLTVRVIKSDCESDRTEATTLEVKGAPSKKTSCNVVAT